MLQPLMYNNVNCNNNNNNLYGFKFQVTLGSLQNTNNILKNKEIKKNRNGRYDKTIRDQRKWGFNHTSGSNWVATEDRISKWAIIKWKL